MCCTNGSAQRSENNRAFLSRTRSVMRSEGKYAGAQKVRYGRSAGLVLASFNHKGSWCRYAGRTLACVVLLNEGPMLDLFTRINRPVVVGSALAVAAVLGWGSFAYSTFASQGRVNSAIVERDAAVAQHDRLKAAAGDLAQVEARLASGRIEYARVVQSWADAKARSEQELATLTKRIDQAKDRVGQTGSIRQAEPAARPARKP